MKVKSPVFFRLVLTGVLALCGSHAMAQSAFLTIASDPSQVNHFPGPDGLIGNGDDVISGSNSSLQNSSPNSIGSYGFNAFKFAPAGPDDPAMPTGFDAITFVNGSVTIDKNVLASGGGSIVSALTITSGTEPFPGHGAYTSVITAVNGGTYDTVSGAFTLDVDFSYTINGSTFNEPGVILSGTAIYQESASFGVNSGNAYFEDVAKPLAQSRGASGALFLAATGTLTGLGYPINATIVALEGVGVTINAGMNDAWVSADAPFQGLFFTVFEDLGLLFLSWFTFDSQIPGGNTATFGASDQRWVTGLGNYSGNTVIMSVELTSGGIFNGSQPLAQQSANYGTISIIFISCNEAVLSYNFPGPGLTGQMTLTRVVPDNVALCETLSQ